MSAEITDSILRFIAFGVIAGGILLFFAMLGIDVWRLSRELRDMYRTEEDTEE